MSRPETTIRGKEKPHIAVNRGAFDFEIRADDSGRTILRKKAPGGVFDVRGNVDDEKWFTYLYFAKDWTSRRGYEWSVWAHKYQNPQFYENGGEIRAVVCPQNINPKSRYAAGSRSRQMAGGV